MLRPTEFPQLHLVLTPAFHRGLLTGWGGLVLMLGTCVLLGCGSPPGPTRVAVEGEVLLDGSPLEEGMIRFIPAKGVDGPAATAKVIHGQFSLTRREGPVVGRHRVEIEATGYQDFTIDDEEAFAAAFARNPRSPLGQNPVPTGYNERSTLTAQISEPGPRHFEFTLSSAGGR
jgi:hypothetical protein